MSEEDESSFDTDFTSINESEKGIDKFRDTFKYMRSSLMKAECIKTMDYSRRFDKDDTKLGLEMFARIKKEDIRGQDTEIDFIHDLLEYHMIDKINQFDVKDGQKFLFAELNGITFTFACVIFDGELDKFVISNKKSFQCVNNIKGKDIDWVLKGLGEIVKKYLENEKVSPFFESEETIFVSFVYGNSKMQFNHKEIIATNYTLPNPFPQEITGKNLFPIFEKFFNSLYENKKFKLLTIMSVSASNMIGMLYILNINKKDQEEEDNPDPIEFRIDANFNCFGAPVTSRWQPFYDWNVFTITDFKMFGSKSIDGEWEYIEYFIRPSEMEFFEKESLSNKDVYGVMSAFSRICELLVFRINKEEDYQNGKKNKDLSLIGFKEICGFMDFEDLSKIFDPDVFLKLKFTLKAYSSFLYNRSATLSALAFIASIEKYFREHVKGLYGYREKPLLTISIKSSQYRQFKDYFDLILRRCNQFASSLFEGRDWQRPKIEFITSPEAEFIGPCLYNLYLEDFEKKEREAEARGERVKVEKKVYVDDGEYDGVKLLTIEQLQENRELFQNITIMMNIEFEKQRRKEAEERERVAKLIEEMNISKEIQVKELEKEEKKEVAEKKEKKKKNCGQKKKTKPQNNGRRRRG